MYKKDDSPMFRILVGNRTHLNDVLKDYKFVKNIFDYINTDSLFSPKKDDVYFLYTKEINLSTKELKKFDDGNYLYILK